MFSPNRVPLANFCAVMTMVLLSSSQSMTRRPSGTEYRERLSWWGLSWIFVKKFNKFHENNPLFLQFYLRADRIAMNKVPCSEHHCRYYTNLEPVWCSGKILMKEKMRKWIFFLKQIAMWTCCVKGGMTASQDMLLCGCCAYLKLEKAIFINMK